MRLKTEQIEIIKSLTKEFFGGDSRVFLFGSRVDDSRKGGDIDLYIETKIKENLIDRKIKMLGELQKELGEQKIDIVINNKFGLDKFIFQVARNEGILL